MFWEPPVARHRVQKISVKGNLERAPIPRDELEGREPRAKLEHERLREVERLCLVAAVGAVRDLDFVRLGHAATRVAISRSSRTTSAFANFNVSCWIRTSSA